jgi:hypothetical protein
VQRDAKLLQVIRTLCSPRSFARGLNGREKQGHQYSDNSDHDKQFNKRKTTGLEDGPGHGNILVSKFVRYDRPANERAASRQRTPKAIIPKAASAHVAGSGTGDLKMLPLPDPMLAPKFDRQVS